VCTSITFANSGFVKPDAYRQPLGTDVAMPYDTFSRNSQYYDEKPTEMFTPTYDWSYVCKTHLWKLLPSTHSATVLTSTEGAVPSSFIRKVKISHFVAH